MSKWLALATAGVLAFGVAACGDDDSSSSASGGSGGGDLSGAVKVDGLSLIHI